MEELLNNNGNLTDINENSVIQPNTIIQDEKLPNDKQSVDVLKWIFRNKIKSIYQYMYEHNLSLEKVKDECVSKNSKLSKSNRDFVLFTDFNLLQKLFNDSSKENDK